MIEKITLRIFVGFLALAAAVIWSCSGSKTTEPVDEPWLEPKSGWNFYYEQRFYDSLFLDGVYTSVRQSTRRFVMRTGDTAVAGGEKAVRLEYVQGSRDEPEGVLETTRTIGYFTRVDTDVFFTDLCSDSIFQAENYFSPCFQSQLDCAVGDKRLYFSSAGRAGTNRAYRSDELGTLIEKNHSEVSEIFIKDQKYEAMRIGWEIAPRAACSRESDYFCGEYYSRDALVARRLRWTDTSDSILYEGGEPVATVTAVMHYNRVTELMDMKATE